MAALVALWELLVRSHIVDFEFLPAPSGIARAFASLLISGALLAPTAHTVQSTLLGWAIASLLGIALGVWLGLSERAWRYSMASVEVMRAIPPIALVPVALLVFGFSRNMELVLIIYVAAWTVLVNAIDGVHSVPVELLEVGRMMRMSRLATIRKLILPSAIANIVVGLRLALSLALVLAVVAEMIGNPAGLGNALVRAQQALQAQQMFAYVVAIGLLGIALNALLSYAAVWAFPGLAAIDGSVA